MGSEFRMLAETSEGYRQIIDSELVPFRRTLTQIYLQRFKQIQPRGGAVVVHGSEDDNRGLLPEGHGEVDHSLPVGGDSHPGHGHIQLL